jgi:hypothetical protein
MSCIAIIENLVSDLIVLLIFVGVGWLLLHLTHRSKLLKFFGINTSRKITIYLSHLGVLRYGSVGADKIQRSYQGDAVVYQEMLVANRYRELFNNFLPSLSDKPGLLSKILISDVQVQILISPDAVGQVDGSNSFVTFGSPAYNVASNFFETNLNSIAKIQGGLEEVDWNPMSKTQSTAVTDISIASTDPVKSDPGTASIFVTPSGAGAQWKPVTERSFLFEEREHKTLEPSVILIDGLEPIKDQNFGIVERKVDSKNRRCAFYTAGVSELGTIGAAYYLSTEWKKLFKKYGEDTDFLVVLRVEPGDYTKSSIIFER